MATKKNDFNDPSLQSSNKSPKTNDTSKNYPSQKSYPDAYSLQNNTTSDNHQPPNPQTITPSGSKKKGPLSRIVVKFDVGFNNSIYLRGEGSDLSWDRGIILKNIKADEWVWETNSSFTKCEFKVLINDRQYELGENHRLQCGTSFEYTPSFHTL